ncbi:efflux transporter outer membrane subunit [Variovorax sp. HJSM1_2]|uniref:efflux transporter outer membrane subunit n=1 Tax=Variovorax sp. HJSM1_2 TaxID=3366263 RepID=UPI003BD9B3B5
MSATPVLFQRSALSLACACAAMMLGACALPSPGSHEELATASAPNRKLPAEWRAAATPAGAVADQWLQGFNDAQLNALVQEALTYSPDLQSVAARVEQAAAYVRVASGLLYPQVNLLARGGGKLSGDSSGLEGLGFFANWEIDLWGRVRAGASAAQSQYVASQLDATYARQSLAAQVAKGWFLATEARLQLALAQETLQASTRLEQLAKDRLRVGIGDEYDVRLTQANLNSLRDTVQNLEQSYLQALRSLEILAGRYPSASLQVSATLPELGTAVPQAGVPSALLERRPDVVAAERRLAAAFYNTEQAKAARLPRLSLTGGVTSVSSSLFVLQDRENPVWSVGANIMAPIFLGGQLQGQVDLRTAEQKQALADYGRIGSKAFGEVENALSASTTLIGRETVLAQAVNDNQAAVELAETRFRVGSIDMRPLLQQRLSLYAAQVALLRVRGEQRVQRVNLHLALGGSFAEPIDSQTLSQNKGTTPAAQ